MRKKLKDLSPIERQEHDEMFRLEQLCHKVQMAWSFNRLKTFRDLYLAAGFSKEDIEKKYHPSELNKELVYGDVKEFLSDLHIELSTKHWLRQNPSKNEWSEYDLERETSAIHEQQNRISSERVEVLEKRTEEHNQENNYGFRKSPKENFSPFWFQKKAIVESWNKIVNEDKRGILVIAGTGTGKTFIAGALFRRFLDAEFHKGKTLSPWPYIYVTKASVVTQSKRVFKKFFNIETNEPHIEVLVTNYDQLRSKFGELFVREKLVVEDGIERVKYIWRPHVNPCVIVWDEPHSLKNLDSQQSQIGQSINDLEAPIYQIQTGATPFIRVVEAKCFCVSTRIPIKTGILGQEKPLTNKDWTTFAEDIATDYGRSDVSIYENSPAAIDRLRTHMDDYIVAVKGIKTQFRAINKVQMISFANKEEQDYYNNAYNRFLKEKAKLMEQAERGLVKNVGFMILVEMLKFRQAAEYVRAPHIAKALWESVTKHNQAGVSACNFKATIIRIVNILVNDYNVPREKISLIWGGGKKKASKKQEAKKLLKDVGETSVAAKLFEESGIDLEDLLKDLDLDDVEDYVEEELDPSLKLGVQNAKERQREIDKFQSGHSLYCLYTFRAGGVGLSLHHTDEFTKEKVRHKESGYAFEEDIPKIPTRQRVNFVAPTYSAIELVQGLGRCPRLTSLSDTPQTLIFYRNTIEERVAHIVSMKLRCLYKVVRQREDWSDCIVGNYTDEQVEQKHLREFNPNEQDDDSSGGLIGEGDEEDE